jgi:pimeloyl-ACP methyl ester carboxylesterase
MPQLIHNLKNFCGVVLAGAALVLGWPAFAQTSTQTVDSAAATQALAERTIQTHDFEWQDTERNRAVPARLYWPEPVKGASADAKVPLVVFSHGLGGSRMGYSYLGRYWAAQGFASLHVQHLGSDRSIWGGSTWERFTKLRAAASDDNALARAKDVSFAITQILNVAEFAPLIDAQSIAVAGHSYGANTALLLAGAQVKYQSKPLSLLDPRVKAAIILSAPPFHGQGDMQPILAGVKIPTLHLTGTEDNISVPGYSSRLEDRVEVFDAVGGKTKLLAVFDGGTHSIFTDRLDRAGPELNKSVKTITREVTAAFLRTTLRGEPPQRLGDVLTQFRNAFTKVSGALPGLAM